MSKKSTRFAEQSSELHLAIQDIAELYGLSTMSERSDAYGLELLMQNSVAGVKFEFSPQEDSGWRAIVGQLSNGQFPKHPVRIDRQSTLQRFDLRDIAALRIELIPALAGKVRDLAPLSAQDVAHILRACCADIFNGDFSLFASLQERVLSRLPVRAARDF